LPLRKANSPWGSSYKEGLPTTSVNDSIDVDQMIRPMVDCGVISKETGQWEGVPTTDAQFIGITISNGVSNSTAILVPDTDAYPSIDMTGFEDLFIAIKPSNGGNVKIDAVMGPATESFGGLSPVDAAKRIEIAGRADVPGSLQTAFYDSAQNLTANVWNIFNLQGMLSNQKNLQLKITNDSGGSSDIEFAFLRTV
jgi:hypothetical protein